MQYGQAKLSSEDGMQWKLWISRKKQKVVAFPLLSFMGIDVLD
jgi:hypothetical protein